MTSPIMHKRQPSRRLLHPATHTSPSPREREFGPRTDAKVREKNPRLKEKKVWPWDGCQGQEERRKASSKAATPTSSDQVGLITAASTPVIPGQQASRWAKQTTGQLSTGGDAAHIEARCWAAFDHAAGAVWDVAQAGMFLASWKMAGYISFGVLPVIGGYTGG